MHLRYPLASRFVWLDKSVMFFLSLPTGTSAWWPTLLRMTLKLISKSATLSLFWRRNPKVIIKVPMRLPVKLACFLPVLSNHVLPNPAVTTNLAAADITNMFTATSLCSTIIFHVYLIIYRSCLLFISFRFAKLAFNFYARFFF